MSINLAYNKKSWAGAALYMRISDGCATKTRYQGLLHSITLVSHTEPLSTRAIEYS